MEIQFYFSNQSKHTQPVRVKSLVSQLLSQFQPLAVEKRSFLLNDVPENFTVHTNESKLTAIMSSLMNSFINKSLDSCIRISAKRYNNIILLRLSHSNATMNFTPDPDWNKVNMLAANLGGCIIEDDIRRSHATITLSFRCLANAA